MSLKRSIIAGFSAVILLSGCETSLSTKTIDINSETIATGWTYYLPQRSFEINYQATITDCKYIYDNDQNEKQLHIKALPHVTIKSEIVAEKNRLLQLNYDDLSAGNKVTTSIVKFYPNGTLKSVNAQADDRTAEIAGNIIKTGLTLASISQGVPINFAKDQKNINKEQIKADEPCDADLRAAITDFRDKRDTYLRKAAELRINDPSELTKLNAEKEKLNAKLKQLQTAYDTSVSEGRYEHLEKIRNEIQNLTKTDVKTNNANIKNNSTTKLTNEVKEAFEKMNKAKVGITASQKTMWIPKIPKPGNDKDPAQLTKEITVSFEGIIKKYERKVTEVNNLALVAMANFTISKNELDHLATKTGLDQKGVIYRRPVRSELKVCTVDSTKKLPDECSKETTIQSAFYMMPQFGKTSYLPFKSKTFGDANLVASFAEDGNLSESTYTSSANLEKMSGFLLNTAKDLQAFHKAKRESKVTEIDGIRNDTEKYNALAERETARKAYEALTQE
ncbi:MAG: hypothetical protein HWE34_18620 [Methylocystaceae bacterium]|nr:hypothetical protein [Methylocystaceae bacterium]